MRHLLVLLFVCAVCGAWLTACEVDDDPADAGSHSTQQDTTLQPTEDVGEGPGASNTVTFPDPTGDWTFTLTFPEGTNASATKYDDSEAYNDQWVDVYLAGYPSDPNAWDPVPVTVSADGYGIDEIRLYPADNKWDPASRSQTYEVFDSGWATTLRATRYYWIYVYADDLAITYDYTMQIFRLSGD